MAFEDKAAAVRAGLLLAQSLARDIGQRWPNLRHSLQVRAGIHHGPAMSATVNGAPDYFGTTVDQALRLPSMVAGDHLVLSRSLAADRRVVELLRAFNLKPEVLTSSLPGQPVGILLSTPLSGMGSQIAALR